MKVKNIYRKLDSIATDDLIKYCKARKDLKLISHLANEFYDSYVFEGTDGYITLDKVIKDFKISYEYGWSTKVVTVVDGKAITVSKE